MLRLILAIAIASPAFAQQPLPPGAFARLGGTALRHPEKPLTLAFRPGTSELASLGSDGTVRIWDTATGKELHLLRKKDHHANAMAFSANGAFLAIHFGENQLWVFNPAKKYETANFANIPMLENMTITSDGKYAAGMHQGEPVLMEVNGDAKATVLPVGSAVAVAPDGKSVAVGRKEENVYFVDVLEVPSGKRMLRMNRPGEAKAAITSVAYAPDSRTLAMASDGGAPIVIFQLGKEEPVAKFDGAGPVAFANEKRICGRKANRMAVWDTAGKLLFENHIQDISAFCLTSDGKLSATDSGGLLGSPRIRLWKCEDQSEVTFGDEPCSSLWQFKTGFRKGVQFRAGGTTYEWLPDVKLGEQPDRSWNPQPIINQPDSRSSNDGKFIVSFRDDGEKFRLESMPWAEPKIAIEAPSKPHDFSVHPEGKSFAVIGRDGVVRVWDRAGKELWTARVARSLRAGIAYSPDGKILAVTSVVKVTLFDSAAGTEIAKIERQWEDGPFTSVCFNHDGSLMAVGSQGAAGSSAVYEVASRTLVKRFEGKCGSVIGVAFTAKEDVLVSAHADDSLLAWRMHTPGKENADPAKLWDALLSKEAEVAWPAMMQLVEMKEKVAEVIAEGLKGEAKTDEEKLRRQRAEVVMNRIKALQK